MDSVGSVQLNVRMPRAIREKGDAALWSMGYTPTEFVRKMWERLARRGIDAESLVEVIEPASEHASTRVASSVESIKTCRANELWSCLMRDVRLTEEDLAKPLQEQSFEELLYNARADQYGIADE